MKMFLMLKEYFEAYLEEMEKCKYDPDYIIRLMNPLYGFKQVGAAWQKRVRAILKELGFVPLISDDTIYINHETGDVIASYVDDFLLFGSDLKRLQELAKAIAFETPITDLGAADWFLGVRIVRSADDGDVRLDQQQYIDKSLKSTGYHDVNPTHTPFVTDHKKKAVRREKGNAIKEETFEYASLVGRFNFSSCISRLDTAYATSIWARFMSNPSLDHQECIKRLSRYLKGTSDMSIRYRKLEKKHSYYKYNSLGLFGAVDLSFSDCIDTGKSTTGYVFFMAGSPIAWLSKLQTIVARHTTEAEYVAFGAAAAEAAGIRNFLTELGVMPDGPITLLEDNTGALKWAEEIAMLKKKRYIRVDYHYIRQEVDEGNVRVEYVPSSENLADGFTKALERGPYKEFVRMLGFEKIAENSKNTKENK